MSFILDALRKAEDKNRDRHKMTVPEGPRVLTEELPEAPPAEFNWGKLAAVLLVAAALIAAWLWQSGRSDKSVIATSPPSPVASQTTSAATSTTGQRTALQVQSQPVMQHETGARALDREAQRGITAPANVQSVASNSGGAPQSTDNRNAASPQQRITPGTVRILEPDGSLPADVVPGQVSEEALPEYRESLISGDVPIPQLHLDMHVFSSEPAKRFVFINLDKYKEGDAIDDDTLIESIEPEGAIINHKGYRFVLRPD